MLAAIPLLHEIKVSSNDMKLSQSLLVYVFLICAPTVIHFYGNYNFTKIKDDALKQYTSVEYSSLATEILNPMPKKVLQFFPIHSSYPFGNGERLSVLERQEIRLKTIQNFCQSKYYLDMDKEPTLNSPYRVTIMKRWGCLGCRITKTDKCFWIFN